MTDNDYIAEYVREKHPAILGFDFAVWKALKIISKGVSDFVDAVHNMSLLDKEEDDGEEVRTESSDNID